MKKGILILLFLAVQTCYSQSEKRTIYRKKLLQFSLTPGVGSNGLHPGGYINYFSLNFTSGYSAANEIIEVAGISNLNAEYTKGLQFAGLVNVTGGNAFAAMSEKEKRERVKNGYEANLSGGQFSGLANVVVTNVFGLQVSGGINLSGNALFGLQMAGVANVVRNYSFGLQLAGLYNSSVNAMDGVQNSFIVQFHTRTATRHTNGICQ